MTHSKKKIKTKIVVILGKNLNVKNLVEGSKDQPGPSLLANQDPQQTFPFNT